MACTITVTGATGNVGRPLAETLLARDHKVRAVGRDAGRLQPLVDLGAEDCIGTVEDAAFLARAYRGADAVFVMIPPEMANERQLERAERISKAHADAIREAGVKYVVALSSLGAHMEKGAGIVKTVQILEREMNALDGVHVHILRPTYFMENVWPQMDIIKNFGFAGGPVAPGAAFPMVATRDIAAMAADRLGNRDFTGHTMEYVLGPRDISYTDIAAALGKALGRRLSYVQVPDGDARAALMHMGMSRDFVDLILEFSHALSDGTAQGHHARTRANTTPTDIDEFAQWFANAYNASM